MYWPHAAMLTYGIGAGFAARLALAFIRRGFVPMGLAWVMVHIAMAALSAAWGILVFTDVDRAVWSETITPASTLFPIVVMLPGFVIMIRGIR